MPETWYIPSLRKFREATVTRSQCRLNMKNILSMTPHAAISAQNLDRKHWPWFSPQIIKLWWWINVISIYKVYLLIHCFTFVSLYTSSAHKTPCCMPCWPILLSFPPRMTYNWNHLLLSMPQFQTLQASRTPWLKCFVFKKMTTTSSWNAFESLGY